MARFNMVGLDDIQKQIDKRSKATQKAIPNMLKAGARVVVKAQREQAKVMFVGDRSMDDLENSIKAGNIKGDEDARYIEVFPHGKDRHGVRNAQKGFVQQYGRSNMAARPWFSTAKNKCQNEISDAMKNEWEAATNG